ncbi:hypothetical protein D172_017010 [Pseudoalteromonas sp. Bsw20308]|nr:hypothetical protein D172_017010 [Pseudoalteromonas sp. Bsw20308]
MNSEMLKTYEKIRLGNKQLSTKLLAISLSGFVSKDECFFLKDCVEINTNITSQDFSDKTGYECFINSINVDDYVKNSFLEQGILFVREVFNLFRQLDVNKTLNCIMSLDEFGLKVKFHTIRTGESWLSDDLEEFEESILIIDSDERSWI